jgi:hypothetical protein
MVREHNKFAPKSSQPKMASSYAIVFQNRPRIVQIERELKKEKMTHICMQHYVTHSSSGKFLHGDC